MLRTIFILAVIAVISGAIAFLGNQLGRYIGKRKMSVLKLRPRYTSMVITVITGAVIALLTVGIFSALSRPVRTFLHGYEKLQKEYQTMQREYKDLMARYYNAMMVANLGEIVFQVNEAICIGKVRSGVSTRAVKEQLDQILSYANQIAIQRNNQKLSEMNKKLIPGNTKLVGYFPEEYKSLISRLSKTEGSFVILVYSAKNTFLKDKVAVRFNCQPNKLVFKKGDLITSTRIDGNESPGFIEKQLLDFLQVVRREAIKKGVFADPANEGRIGDIPISILRKKAEDISYLGGPVEVNVIADADTYSVGPLKIKFVLKPVYQARM
ncbi:MAG: DUF3084 domain-containing protein [Candidatus Eremiobacteraeota bacterium]|nr:DUF3084 domain-containing protein [Candidatus Eremiobacteraeota bacterium]